MIRCDFRSLLENSVSEPTVKRTIHKTQASCLAWGLTGVWFSPSLPSPMCFFFFFFFVVSCRLQGEVTVCSLAQDSGQGCTDLFPKGIGRYYCTRTFSASARNNPRPPPGECTSAGLRVSSVSSTAPPPPPPPPPSNQTPFRLDRNLSHHLSSVHLVLFFPLHHPSNPHHALHDHQVRRRPAGCPPREDRTSGCRSRRFHLVQGSPGPSCE